MKKLLIYSLVISFCSLGFNACSDEDDDDPVTPQTNTPTNGGGGSGSGGGPGSGGGQGTGGGTGSGGIPPNTLKVTVDGVEIDFDTVSAVEASGQVFIFGFELSSNYPNLQLDLASTLSADTFLVNNFGSPSLTYSTDSTTFYSASSGYVAIRTIDTSRRLVNGRFEVVMLNDNDLSDSLIFTNGQFNKFYD